MLYVSILSIFSIFALAGCESENENSEPSNLEPENEVVAVMRNFLKEINADAVIKKDDFQWLNYAEYDYNNYDGWTYDIYMDIH